MVLTRGKNTEERNWERVPLIPFKFNSNCIPLLARCKNLQDAINEIVSSCKDVMEEDARNTILVLENYGGTDLAELRQNLATFSAIKVEGVDGSRGDVRTLQIEFNAENYEKVLAIFKKAMLKNCRGFDLSELKSGSPNQMNIKSVYSDIDLDANNTETECQASMEQLIWFVNRFLNVSGDTDVDVIFNRDGVVNEVEINTMLFNGGMKLSQKTLVSQCSLVDDPDEELEQVKKEEQEAMDAYAGMMPMAGAPAPKNPAQGGLNNENK
jgi:SPP1 family phage portal protein